MMALESKLQLGAHVGVGLVLNACSVFQPQAPTDHPLTWKVGQD